jgi:uncharacterized protein (TIGR03435 family)
MGQQMYRSACTALVITALAAAQTPPAFEAASIKRHNDPNSRNVAFQILPSGRVHMVNLPLYIIISIAYDLPFQSQTERLSGGPEWVKSETYDIEATAGTMAPEMTSEVRIHRMKLMLQTLLAERFHLQVRKSAKDMPVYTLTVAKNGPKLTPAKIGESDCPTASINPPCHEINGGIGRGLHGKAVTVSDIAYYAQNWSDRPLLDRTELSGLYEVDTEGWVPMTARPPSNDGNPPSAEAIAMADPARPTLFLIMDRLGLRMEPGKGSVDVWVIEHVERPSEN